MSQNNTITHKGKNLKLSKRQLYKYNYIKKHSLSCCAEDYLDSISGEYNRVHVPKFHHYDPFDFKNSGEIFERQRRLMIKQNIGHSPMIVNSKTRWIGVEIECYIDGINFNDGEECSSCPECCGYGIESFYDEDGELIEEIDCSVCGGSGSVECHYYDDHKSVLNDLISELNKENVSRCSVRYDGSLGENGVELCLLFDSNRGFRPLKRLCKVLKKFGATVDHSCGLHVHLDHSKQDFEDAEFFAHNYDKFLPILSKFVAPSRLDNQYCQLKVSEGDDDRYCAINLNAFDEHGTIEIRLHQGTTNFYKIRNWIELLIEIENQYSNTTIMKDIDSWESFTKSLKLPDRLVKYYRDRFKKFGGQFKPQSRFSVVPESSRIDSMRHLTERVGA